MANDGWRGPGGRLLEALREWSEVDLVAGAEHVGTVRDGDLDLEVRVIVRRHVDSAAVAQHRAAALELLERSPYLVERCGCYVEASTWIGRKHHRQCRHPLSAVIVYEAGGGSARDAARIKLEARAVGDVAYLFVCARHRHPPAGQLAPSRVIALVELPSGRLAELRKALERRREGLPATSGKGPSDT